MLKYRRDDPADKTFEFILSYTSRFLKFPT